MKNKKHKGITLLELIVVIGISTIFAAGVTVNLSGGRQKANDSAALEAMSGTSFMALRCLSKDSNLIRMTATRNGPICCQASSTNPTALCQTYDSSIPNWPPFGMRRWDFWPTFCSVSGNERFGETPPGRCAPYADGTCGGSRANHSFCYIICNPRSTCRTTPQKAVWCTERGCKKYGF